MLPNEVLGICRLCLVKEHVNVNIFENNSRQLFYKIAACLPVSIAADDKLPKKVCLSCYNKVNLLYEFWKQTLDAEKHLLAWLNGNVTCSINKSHDNCDLNKEKPSNLTSLNHKIYDKNINHRRDRHMTDTRLKEFLIQTQEDNSDNYINSTGNGENFDIVENKDIKFTENKLDEKCISTKSNLLIKTECEEIKPGPSGFQDNSALKRLQGTNQNNPTDTKDPLCFNEQEHKIASNADVTCEETLKEEVAKLQPFKIKLRKRALSKIITKNRTFNSNSGFILTDALSGKHRKKKLKTKSDSDEKEKEFCCKHCDQVFESVMLRTKHEKTIHMKRDIRYNCDKCDYSTYTKGCFTTHLKRHIKQYNLYCKECNLGFFNNTELTSHNIKSHDMQPFQCAICNDLFTSKGNLYSHIKSHDPNNSYVCEVCGRTYKKKNSYKRHITRSHLGLTTKAQCSICEKTLSSKEHLRRHMLTHTDERNWVCSTCGKCFLSKTYLTEHSRIHLGIRPYKCEICEKCFTQRGSLTIHKRSHTGERPFRCEYCSKGFVMSTLLRYHLRKCEEAKLDTNFFSQVESNASQLESLPTTVINSSIDSPFNKHSLQTTTTTTMMSTERPKITNLICSKQEPISIISISELN